MYLVYKNQAAPAYSSFFSSFFFLSNFQTLNVFVTLFSGTVRLRRFKFGTHVDNGQMYRVYRNQAAALIHPFISSFFFLSNFQILKFSSHFSQELWNLEGWNLLHTWKMGGCIVYTGIILLLLFVPLDFSFFFLSNFQTLKILVTLFSGTVRPRRSKLGTLMDSGQMYRVYRNQAAAAYLSLYFFIFLSLQFSNIENFRHTFFLSNFQTLKFFVTLFSGIVRPRRLKLSTYVDSGQMYRVYRNQAAAAYLSLYFSFFFLSNFQTLKFFVTLFSRTVRPRSEKLVHSVISSFFSLQFSVANLSLSSYSAIVGL